MTGVQTCALPICDRLTGSLASAMIGVTEGVDLVRVHDVKETRKAIETINALS